MYDDLKSFKQKPIPKFAKTSTNPKNFQIPQKLGHKI